MKIFLELRNMLFRAWLCQGAFAYFPHALENFPQFIGSFIQR
jgi:hypothetical protein